LDIDFPINYWTPKRGAITIMGRNKRDVHKIIKSQDAFSDHAPLLCWGGGEVFTPLRIWYKIRKKENSGGLL
jgi:hypothetical protein